jgi:5,10-methylenetetrahydrofolate reductase
MPAAITARIERREKTATLNPRKTPVSMPFGMTLAQKLLDPSGTYLLYGTTPPREGSPEALVQSAAHKLAARIGRRPLDGLIVYDLQDESARTAAPRPFPFARTIDSRVYASLLGRLTGREAVTYKCIGEIDEAGWQAWLDATARDSAARTLAIVGRPSSGVAAHAMPLTRAFEIAAAHEARFTLGGVAIAERHASLPSESTRMLAKAEKGCRFFVTQAIYDPEATVLLLRDYARGCRDRGLSPARVVFTFTPCGREKTMAFMKWLGISISEATARAILAAPSPIARSVEVCLDGLRAILAQPGFEDVPLGVNVESVSINRDEIDASVELLDAVAALLTASGRRVRG